MANDPEIQILLDKDQIHDLVMRYCRGVDRGDAEILASVFHDDSTIDIGMFTGPPAEFVSFIMENNKSSERTSHNVSNELIVVEGDMAWAEFYVVGYVTAEVDGQLTDAMVGGRYLDRFEKRGGVWKIAHHQFVMDWNRNGPCTAEWEEGMYGQLTIRGARGKDDPVYKL